MHRFFPLIFLLFNLCFATPYVTEDFSKGRDVSEGYHLPIALVFTGSDWSDSSKMLMTEIAKENFSSDLVVIQIDFPELNTQKKEILWQNHTLKETFQVETFPMIVLLDEEQNEITRLGYPIQEVTDFGSHLKEIKRHYFLLQKRFEKAKQTKDKEELKACFHAAKKMGADSLATTILDIGFKESLELMVEKYITLIGTEEGNELRKSLIIAENEEVQTRLALLDFQESHSAEPLKQYLKKFGKKGGEQCAKVREVLADISMNKEEVKKTISKVSL